MNVVYKLTFGTQYDKNQKLINLSKVKDQYNQLLLDIADHFGGLSEADHIGHYKHDSGETIVERSTSIEILASETSRASIIAVAQDLKDILNQESVLLTETKVNGVFI